jgi:hypothetical protein
MIFHARTPKNAAIATTPIAEKKSFFTVINSPVGLTVYAKYDAEAPEFQASFVQYLSFLRSLDAESSEQSA